LRNATAIDPPIPLPLMTTTLPYSVSSGSSFSVFEKLRGEANYVEWKKAMRAVLRSLRQWDIITGSVTVPTPADPANPTPDETAAIKAFEVRTVSLFLEITCRVDVSVKSVIGDLEDPKLIWELLEKRYGATKEGLKSILRAKLQLMKWDGNGSIMAHRDAMVALRSELAAAGYTISDDSFYEHFLDSLPRSMSVFVALYDHASTDVDVLCSKFTRYEMRVMLADIREGKASDPSGSSMALASLQPSTSKGKGKGRKRDLSDVTCYGCGKKGHLRRNCPDGAKGGKKPDDNKGTEKPKDDKPKADADKSKAPTGTLFTAMGLSLVATDSTDTFYIDSGASDHLIPTRSDMLTYQEFSKPKEISTANGGSIYAYGSGTLRVASSANGREREAELRDVYYAPGVHARLVSLGKLQQQGWEIRLLDGGMELTDRDGGLFATVETVNNVFPIKLNVIRSTPALATWTMEVSGTGPTHDELVERLGSVAMVASARGAEGGKATLLTWHRRLGHSSFKTVVASAKGVTGMEITDLPTKVPGLDACAACVAAKSVHLPHKEGRSRAGEFLERVHIDIAGPMPVKSAGGKSYLYIVVDDYTRAVYVKPLALKSEAADAFKAYKAVAENESGKKIREILTDNARELSMGEMRDICEQEGIKLHTTVPYHPASNGVAERTIGVLTGAVRAMLKDSGLPDSLWAEAFVTAAYVHNRTPTRALEGLTPFEARYETKPDLAHLRAFGAPCSIVEPLVKLKKLDERARMCFFVGYKYGGGGYRVWDPKGKVVVESRDILFYEDGLPPPTLSEARTQPPPVVHAIDDEPLAEPVSIQQPPPVDPEPLQPVGAHPRITIRLPGRRMPVPSAEIRGNDVTLVPDYPAGSTRSGLTRGGEVEEGDAMLTLEGESHPVAFSAGLPNGILLSRLPDPRSVREAMAAPDAEGWKDAMDREMENLRSHDVYDLVPRAPGLRTLRLGWVLHRKFKNGVFEKNKARVVARGNHQRPGVDYNESFSPVMRLESLRTLLALAAIRDLDVVQFDITSAYLHGTLKEELYMEQPEGYKVVEKPDWVWKLKKGLYGLVQAGRTWNEELHSHMVGAGLAATHKDPAVYVKGDWDQEDFVAGGFWVDDFVGIGSGKDLEVLAKGVDEKYGITGFGDVKWILGMLVERDRTARTISISQEAFITSLLTRFNLSDATPVSTPLLPGAQLSMLDCPDSEEEKLEMKTRPYRELVGALAWLALGTRPDIAFAAASLARFGHNPGRTHWEAAKRVLRYLGGTKLWRLTLGGGTSQLAVFTDADWGSHRDDRRSVGAYLVKIGDGVVSWKSKKQSCVALSSTEAEYMAQFHYTRELISNGRIVLNYVPTADMLADLLTKSLPRVRHVTLSRGIGLF